MKVALINDTHWGVRNDMPQLMEYQKKSHEWFFKIIDEKKIERSVHLGDVFDRRKYINFVTAKACRNSFILPIQERGIKTDIIGGNHDVYYKNTNNVSSLEELIGDKYDCIKIHMEPTLIEIDGTAIQLLPWINENNYEASIGAIKTSRADVLMGHLEVQGFALSKNIISPVGIDPTMFSRYDSVYSGHFHHQSRSGPIHFLGAFCEFVWSDFADPRGFHIFDTATRETEFFQNPLTIFRMIDYDDVRDKNIMKTIDSYDYSTFENCFVKVVCFNRTNPYAFDLLLDRLYKSSPIDISVVEPMTTIIETQNVESKIDQTEDTPTILNKYIDALQLPVDNDEMKKYMRGIYEEAVSTEHID